MMENSSQLPDSHSAEYYHALVSAFPNGVLVLFDNDLRYQIVGPEILPFSKRDAADMVGKTVEELFPQESAERLKPELRATLNGDSRSFDMEYDRNIHHLETTPVRIDDEPFGVLVTQEVTEERETTEELADKTRRLETVAHVLSHDLRNPLTVALGHIETINDEGDIPHQSMDAIRQALLRMDAIMSDALVLARETTLSDVEVVDIQKHAKATWELVPTETAILETEGTLHVEADPGLLSNLFENLIQNAVSHGGQSVTVRVGVLEGEDGFFVEDDGSGIPPEIRDNIFESGISTKGDEDHSGLGLAIVKAITDSHEWDIRVTDAKSGGARFEISGVGATK